MSQLLSWETSAPLFVVRGRIFTVWTMKITPDNHACTNNPLIHTSKSWSPWSKNTVNMYSNCSSSILSKGLKLIPEKNTDQPADGRNLRRSTVLPTMPYHSWTLSKSKNNKFESVTTFVQYEKWNLIFRWTRYKIKINQRVQEVCK